MFIRSCLNWLLDVDFLHLLILEATKLPLLLQRISLLLVVSEVRLEV